MKTEFLGSNRSSRRRALTRAAAACAVAALPLSALFVPVAAQNAPPSPTGQSFLVLDPDVNGTSTTPARFTQELFATTQLAPFSGNVGCWIVMSGAGWSEAARVRTSGAPAQTARMTSAESFPPKASEVEIAQGTGTSRATFATTST